MPNARATIWVHGYISGGSGVGRSARVEPRAASDIKSPSQSQRKHPQPTERCNSDGADINQREDSRAHGIYSEAD
jgi:hypothetical protein